MLTCTVFEIDGECVRANEMHTNADDEFIVVFVFSLFAAASALVVAL